MATYNPDKKIKIEIMQPVSPAYGYSILDIRDKDKSRCIERDADDEDIQYILMPDQYRQFKDGGKYKFVVPINVLTNLFSYFA